VFLNRLLEYSQCLRIALSSCHFFNDPNFSESELQHYKDRLQFFTELAHLVRRDAEPMLSHRGTYAVKPNVLNGIVQGLQVRQDKHQYQVLTADEFDVGFTPLPEYNEVQHWSDEKVRSHADLICSRVTHSIAVELDADPYAQQMLGALLQRSLAKLNAKFISPLEHYSALTEIQQRVVHRQVEGLPPGLRGQADASVWYGIFMLALSPDDVTAATPEAKLTWEQQALAMAVWIRKGELENSLNHSGLENMIRNRLLRELFPLFLLPKLLTLQQVLALVEQVLQVVRIHMRDQAH
jgi:type I restriction enzyme R subunit